MGTAVRSMTRPLGRSTRASTSPTGSGRSATARMPWAMPAMRSGDRASRSSITSEMVPRAASRSWALAARMSGWSPLAMTMSQPRAVTSLAARSLVAMPPVPRALPAPPARASMAGVTSSTVGMSLAAGSLRGSAVYRPSMSLRRISRSAWTAQATMPPRVSLSPTLISAVATVSFSLMMGRAPSSSRRAMVFSKFRRRSSWSTSSPVSRLWATVWLNSENSLS